MPSLIFPPRTTVIGSTAATGAYHCGHSSTDAIVDVPGRDDGQALRVLVGCYF